MPGRQSLGFIDAFLKARYSLDMLADSPDAKIFETPLCSDQRLYFWLPSHEVAFFQGLIEAEENLARIRTEKHREQESLIVLMFDESRYPEVEELLCAYTEESNHLIEYVDSQGRSFV